MFACERVCVRVRVCVCVSVCASVCERVCVCLPPQVYNEFNARSLGDKWFVWGGLAGNPVFVGVIIVTIGVQIFVVQVAGSFTSCTPLTIEFWGWSFLLGFGTVPVGILMRFIPVREDPQSFANYYGLHPTPADAVSVPVCVYLCVHVCGRVCVPDHPLLVRVGKTVVLCRSGTDTRPHSFQYQ